MSNKIQIGKLYITNRYMLVISPAGEPFMPIGEIVIPIEEIVIPIDEIDCEGREKKSLKLLNTDGKTRIVRFLDSWSDYMIPVDEQPIL